MPPSSGLTRGPLVGENGFCDQHRNGAFNCGPAGADNGELVGERRALSLLNAGEFLQMSARLRRSLCLPISHSQLCHSVNRAQLL